MLSLARAWVMVWGAVCLMVACSVLSGCALVLPECPKGLALRDGMCEGFGEGFSYQRGVSPVASGKGKANG